MSAVGRVPSVAASVAAAAAVKGSARELLILLLVQVPLFHETRHVLLELLHLALERALFAFKHVTLLHALVAARLRVAAVLQGSPFLLETDHLFFAEASQLPVKLAHCHAHQLLVREAVLEARVRVVAVVMMVVVVHRVVVTVRGRREVFSDVLLTAESLVGLVVVMVVVRVTDECFHRVLGRQVEGLWTYVMLIVGNPVEIVQLRLARGALGVVVVATVVVVDAIYEVLPRLRPGTGGTEAGRGRHRGAGCADRGGGQRARGQAVAIAVGLRGLFLDLKLHEVEVVDIFNSQRAVGQICAHGEIGGHVSPCDDTYPNSQSDTRGFHWDYDEGE